MMQPSADVLAAQGVQIKGKWHTLTAHGCAVALAADGQSVYYVPGLAAGGYEWENVGVVEVWDTPFLRAVNKALGTSFTLSAIRGAL